MSRGLVMAVLAVALSGCGGHRLVVTDQVSGQPVTGLTVVAGSAARHGDGSVSITLPDDDRTLVTVRADGYQPWSAPVRDLRGRSSTAVLLDPRWVAEFSSTPPASVRNRKPCPCHQRTSR